MKVMIHVADPYVLFNDSLYSSLKGNTYIELINTQMLTVNNSKYLITHPEYKDYFDSVTNKGFTKYDSLIEDENHSLLQNFIKKTNRNIIIIINTNVTINKHNNYKFIDICPQHNIDTISKIYNNSLLEILNDQRENIDQIIGDKDIDFMRQRFLLQYWCGLVESFPCDVKTIEERYNKPSGSKTFYVKQGYKTIKYDKIIPHLRELISKYK